jgi:hypothetical protein
MNLPQNSPVNLQTLPHELLDPIFRLACMDGGKTAAALSSTSHHMKSLVASYRYDNVALIGPRSICAFARLLRTPGRLPVNLKHLFLSDQEAIQNNQPDYQDHPDWESVHDAYFPNTNDRGSGASTLSLFTRRRKESDDDHKQRAETARSDKLQHVQKVLTFILESSSSSLTHLTLITQSTAHMQYPLIPVKLPFLLELTCWYTGTGQSNAPDASIIASQELYNGWIDAQRALLPSLLRLHVMSSYLSSNCFYMQAVPRSVTHLRISNEANSQHLLRLLISPPLNWWPPVVANADSWLPPGLTDIFVLPSPDVERYFQALRLWQASSAKDSEMGKRIRMVGDGEHRYTLIMAHGHWLDRVHGGLGSWNLSV